MQQQKPNDVAASMPLVMLLVCLFRSVCVAGDVATFAADDLRPLQRVKGAHMVFTTALAFSQDERAMLTVSADASALATQVSKTPTAALPSLNLMLALIICIFAVIVAAFAFSRGSRDINVLDVFSQQAGKIQQGAQEHANVHQEL